MKREPVLLIAGLLVAIAVAALEEFGKGNIDSLEDFLTIALPLLGAAIARGYVTPTADPRH